MCPVVKNGQSKEDSRVTVCLELSLSLASEWSARPRSDLSEPQSSEDRATQSQTPRGTCARASAPEWAPSFRRPASHPDSLLLLARWETVESDVLLERRDVHLYGLHRLELPKAL